MASHRREDGAPSPGLQGGRVSIRPSGCAGHTRWRNLGWVLLQRTGPARFSETCLTHFKRRGGGGNRNGYLIDANGEPIPTLTEIDAFRVLGIAWVEPEKRAGYESIKAQERWHDPLPEEAIPF
ncbi:MAG: hypothetical protein Kow00105_05820 [Phycisphaeraceae bacterium]